MMNINIAIDGTSGVGKSSVADLLAEKYGMRHLDTGAMYRCCALALQKADTDLQDEKSVRNVLDAIEIDFEGDNVLLNGEDVSRAIRADEISLLTSKVSQLSAVREKMVQLQQQIAAAKGYIVDGRDICSVVLPDAEVKVFLSASAAARAMRRMKQNQEMGMQADYEKILQEIEQRDYQDMNRAISPLKKAEDAVEIDTSALSLAQVADAISKLVDAAAAGKGAA